ncbi:MAG: glycosyltransferase family 4 protein [Odoribacteraceae bacterium]|jgi:glycosyltransferase involved in cell wall biosynthesis|nr:glycosyltransferase family 4 protein [Odoribacteraceae bacterium]
MHDDKKIKVAYFLGALKRGGMETLLLDLLRQAGEAPYEMLVIYREEGNMAGLFKNEAAGRGETGKRTKLVRLTPRKGLDILFLWRLRRLLRQEKVDIVHAQHPLEAAYAWLACLATRVKVVETLHGYDFNQTRKGHRIMRWMLRRARLNIFVSETQRGYYAKKYRLRAPERQVVVYNGIHFAKIERGAGATCPVEGVEEYARPGTWLLGMVGSFVPVRDQMTVCRFLVQLKAAGHAFHLFFVGNADTPEGEACLRYCQENGLSNEVSFLGVRDDVPALLSRLDAFVYASHHDTFGIAVVEAIAAAVPVFVNDWEVMQEVTDNGTLAVLYKTGDEEDLLRHFLHFITQPDLYRERAAVAATRVREQYNIRQYVSHLYACYARMCHRDANAGQRVPPGCHA